MKIKSYSLVEVIVASTIFMAVVVISLSSFAMIKKSNDQTEDIRATNQCARQLEDYIISEVRSSNFGKRVMGIENINSKYYLREIIETDTIFSGVLLIKSDNLYKAIYKYEDGYYTADADYTGNLDSGMLLSLNPSVDTKLNSTDCSAFVQNVPNFVDTANKTFGAIKVVSSPGANDPNETVYIIDVKDAFYRKYYESQVSSLERKTFSSVYLKVSNNLGAI